MSVLVGGEAPQLNSGGFAFSSRDVSPERRAISSPVNSSGAGTTRAHTSNQAFRRNKNGDFF